MDYKIKKTRPKREDIEYTEIGNFEDFELINNIFYEMGIRTKTFKELTKKYAYCDNLSNQINKLIKRIDPWENIKAGDYTENESTAITVVKKTAKENFEETLKQLEEDPLKKCNAELYKSLELDFEILKKEIQVLSLESKTDEELIDMHSWIDSFLFIIPEIINKNLYIDFLTYYYDDEDDKNLQKNVEYEESNSTSLYIKREFKKNYYIETSIDTDNDKVSRTLHPLTKRKLLTDHILKFSSNHLIIHNQSIKFLESFFKTTQIKIKKQIALADTFFCYDYYKYRLEEVSQQNEKREKKNLDNIFLQESLERIKEINNDTLMTDQQKKKERASYEKIIEQEKLKPIKKPTINKTSKFYIFNEPQFKKSGINNSTALKYYDWIKPYIDDYEYINIINSEQLF